MLADIGYSSPVGISARVRNHLRIRLLVGKASTDIASKTELCMAAAPLFWAVAASTGWKAPRATREHAHANRILTTSNVGRWRDSCTPNSKQWCEKRTECCRRPTPQDIPAKREMVSFHVFRCNGEHGTVPCLSPSILSAWIVPRRRQRSCNSNQNAPYSWKWNTSRPIPRVCNAPRNPEPRLNINILFDELPHALACCS